MSNGIAKDQALALVSCVSCGEHKDSMLVVAGDNVCEGCVIDVSMENELMIVGKAMEKVKLFERLKELEPIMDMMACFHRKFENNQKQKPWMKQVCKRSSIDKHKAGVMAFNMNYRMTL